MDQLGHVGDGDEDAAAYQGDEHDGAGHVLARFDGLLGEGGDGVEPEERVGGDGGTGRDGGEAGRIVEERLGAGQAAGALRGHHVYVPQLLRELQQERSVQHSFCSPKEK